MKRLIKIVPILLFSFLLISCNKKNIETKDTITIPDTSIPTEKESETKVSKTTEIVREEYSSEIMDYYLSEPVGTNDAKGVGPFIMAYLQM